MSDTVQQADKILTASSHGAADASSILAAHSEVVKTMEKLKAEGKHEEAAKMEEVAAKLQVSLQAQSQPARTPIAPPQKAATPRMEAAVDKLKEEGLGELAAMMSTTVQQADQILVASSAGTADAGSIIAAHSDVVKTMEKLKAEGKHEEAAKMEVVAFKLQVSLQAQT